MSTQPETAPAAAAAAPAAATPAPAPAAPPAGFGPVAGVSKDRDGRVFDAAKFLPEKDEHGRWKRINGPGKPGRPKGSTNKPKPAEAAGVNRPPADFSDVEKLISAPAAAPGGESAAAAGEPGSATAETMIGVIQTAFVLIGEEEGVLTEGEKLIIRRPLVRVLRKYEIGDDVLPEELDLAFAVASLFIARLKKPKTATWAAKARAWVVNTWFSFRGRSLAASVREHAAPAAGA